MFASEADAKIENGEITDAEPEIQQEFKPEIDLEIRSWKESGKRALFGIFMGLSDGVVGYSGGTTLSVLGFYEKFINNLKNIFVQVDGTRKNWWKYLVWCLPFMLMWGGVLAGFLVLVSTVSNTQLNEFGNIDKPSYGVALVFLFATMAMFSIFTYYVVEKPKIPYSVTSFNQLQENGDKPKLNMFVAGFSFIVLIAVAFIIRFVDLDSDNATDGISFIGAYIPTFTDLIPQEQMLGTEDVILYMIAGVVAAFFMLVPGVSGSFILYLFGAYVAISNAVTNVLEGNDLNYSIGIIVTTGVGAICGFMVGIFTISFLLKRFSNIFKSFSFGLVAASFIATLIALSPTDYSQLTPGHVNYNQGVVIATALLPLLAVLINASILLFFKKKGWIDFKFKKNVEQATETQQN